MNRVGRYSNQNVKPASARQVPGSIRYPLSDDLLCLYPYKLISLEKTENVEYLESYPQIVRYPEKTIQEHTAVSGIVMIHAVTIRLTIPQFTEALPCVAPTPIIHPLMA